MILTPFLRAKFFALRLGTHDFQSGSVWQAPSHVPGALTSWYYVNSPQSTYSNLRMFVFVFSEKLLNSEGRELRRALFSLKQIFQVSF
jgi:hypothetical protein